MGQRDRNLGLVADLVRRMAGTDGVVARVHSMLDLVRDAVGADVGFVVRVEEQRAMVRVMGGPVPRGRVELVSRPELSGARDPVLDPVSGGDLTPRSAEREFGAAAWASSAQRAWCVGRAGVDQVVTLPLVGGPELVVAMFGRRGEDFSDDDLGRLGAIQPVVADVVALAGLRRMPWPDDRPQLTVRETEVLVLLSQGHPCSRIARILGASPRTVEVHLGRIYSKLGVRDRLAAVLAAYDLALVPPRSEALLGTPSAG